MFYCDKCAKEKSWPESLAKSTGPCEVCGETALCNDKPSRSLPKKKQSGRGVGEATRWDNSPYHGIGTNRLTQTDHRYT